MTTVPSVRARYAEPDEAIQANSSATAAVDDEAKADETIACAACSAAITGGAHRITVSGSHDHRFVNPAGLTFHLGCFAAAIGCRIVGPDSLEYPWFPGFSWRYAMCGACGCHLGWHFRKSDQDGFFGLILDRLRMRAADA